METSMSSLLNNVADSQSKNKSPALTRRRDVRVKSEDRIKREQLAVRQSWAIDQVAIDEAVVTAQIKHQSDAEGPPDWTKLLSSVGRDNLGAWVRLDKALAPYCMGATGPMNPKVLHYLTEIRLHRDRIDQVEKVIDGITTILPFMLPKTGQIEFRIKCSGTRKRDKNWLLLRRNGSADVMSTCFTSASFCDLRSALLFLTKERFME
jgi:hypothetical protein